jgi:hypothetical protein
MKKVESYVFSGLIMVCLLVVGCAGLSSGTSGRQSTGGQGNVVEAAVIAEVQDSDYQPRRNPAAEQATSAVYALPAVPLKPEAERLPTPVYAISGIRGQEIQEGNPWEVVDIWVKLPANEFFSRGIVEGEDVSDWIVNLPAGLEGRVHNVRRGATSVHIYISGTPEVTAREEIRVKIPGTYLTGGSELNFKSPTEVESNSAWEASQTANQ